MAAGEASEILALVEHGGTQLAPEQRLLTPFQRMVILKEIERQQNDHERKQAANQRVNPASQGGGSTMQGETVTYVNEGS